MAETNLEKYKTRLTDVLVGWCTEKGLLKGQLLNSPDIDSKWQEMAPEYYGDSIKEFNSYPDAVLAWAAYLGMAVAYGWDRDWESSKELKYEYYRGPRGFDYMDEHIQEKILGYKLGSPESDALTETARKLSEEAEGILRHSGFEPGTVDAYKATLLTISVMYSIGEAIELDLMGYRLEKL